MVCTAFVETSVLTNLLLKEGQVAEDARKAIAAYDAVIVPQFSWKEFKRGPLSYFIWAHNKLTECNDLADFMDFFHKLSRGQRRYHISTVIEAISGFFRSNTNLNIKELQDKYGDTANMGAIQADMMRIYIKSKVYKSWNTRKKMSGASQFSLDCYQDADLYEKKGKNVIEDDPSDCPKGAQCCLQAGINKLIKDVEKVGSSIEASIASGSTKKELIDRSKTIRQLTKHQSRIMDRRDCRAFGDAYFVLWCPESAEIVTINLSDIVPMAQTLGKSVAVPTENGPVLKP